MNGRSFSELEAGKVDRILNLAILRVADALDLDPAAAFAALIPRVVSIGASVDRATFRTLLDAAIDANEAAHADRPEDAMAHASRADAAAHRWSEIALAMEQAEDARDAGARFA